jgi:hypothetical protein
MNKLLVQYRWHIRQVILTLGWATLVAALGLYLYLRITGTLDELVALRSALPVITQQRNVAMQNNAMGLRDFKAALQDKQIQEIYIKPLCERI